jgi:hypothetical protein
MVFIVYDYSQKVITVFLKWKPSGAITFWMVFADPLPGYMIPLYVSFFIDFTAMFTTHMLF